MSEHEKELCRQFAATLLRASANDVVAVKTIIRPADVELLDAPTAVIFTAAVGVARTHVDPKPLEVHTALLRDGHFAGHQGELVKKRMLDATSGVVAHGERLHVVAGQLLSALFRARLAAAGAALSTAAVEASEPDCWQFMIREGVAVRGLWERLAATRPPGVDA